MLGARVDRVERVQPRSLTAEPTRYASACDVPATSQVRILSVFGCWATAYPNPIRSVWVSNMNTGIFRSVRMRRFLGTSFADVIEVPLVTLPRTPGCG